MGICFYWEIPHHLVGLDCFFVSFFYSTSGCFMLLFSNQGHEYQLEPLLHAYLSFPWDLELGKLINSISVS